MDANWNCEEFCPNGGEEMTPFGVDGYTDMGPTTVCTDSGCVAGELWESVDTFPIGNITMETDDFYVNQTNMANAVPIIDVDTLTPFGECGDGSCSASLLIRSEARYPAPYASSRTLSPCIVSMSRIVCAPSYVSSLLCAGEYVGQSNTTYLKWAPGPQSNQFFTVNGASTCQRAKNCNSGVRQSYRLALRQKSLWLNGHLQAKMDAAKAQLAAAQEQMNALASQQ